ncbi:hypothetical protein MATL_G00053130 [Megalops atlanticus]|uniref:RNA-binding motif protein, X-linked 2 n=1 Tax=Megalops atlanticus TaxID=7932 RepID=A0A9D3TB15_MEGAT|nr:hypothetical protein MATL_G00053130 [Megalops atlanticus]
MNPLTKVKLINELNEREAQLGIKDTVSWHSHYKDSAWIFVGGFPYELTEGDIICVFSQYGEIANINLVRDKKTGKSKGFCFVCYEDQRSTILAVDNFNGIKIKGRTIRVDHVQNYRPPKDSEDIDDVTKRLREEGCAPQRPPTSSSESEEEEYAVQVKKPKKDKKEKKKKKKEKKEKKKALKEEKREGRTQSPVQVKREERREGRVQSPLQSPVQVKREKEDAGYDKYAQQRAPEDRLPRGERRTHEERNPRERAHGDRHDNRERDGWAREEERRRHRGREDEGDGRGREGNGRHWDSERTRRDERHQRTEGRHREDSNRERERSASYRERSRDREYRKN